MFLYLRDSNLQVYFFLQNHIWPFLRSKYTTRVISRINRSYMTLTIRRGYSIFTHRVLITSLIEPQCMKRVVRERSFMINKRLARIYRFSLAPPKSHGRETVNSNEHRKRFCHGYIQEVCSIRFFRSTLYSFIYEEKKPISNKKSRP